MKNSFTYLYLLEERVPPEEGQHHSLEVRKLPAAEGGKSKPVVVIRRPGGRVTIVYLEGSEVGGDPADLVDHTVAFLGRLG
jgi:hypothetical protein